MVNHLPIEGFSPIEDLKEVEGIKESCKICAELKLEHKLWEKREICKWIYNSAKKVVTPSSKIYVDYFCEHLESHLERLDKKSIFTDFKIKDIYSALKKKRESKAYRDLAHCIVAVLVINGDIELSCAVPQIIS